MCLFQILAALSPRLAAIFWWLFQPNRWDNAFDSWIWPVLGIVLVPWTTIMFVAVAPFGNVSGSDWVWLAFGVLFDLVNWSGQAARSRTEYYARY